MVNERFCIAHAAVQRKIAVLRRADNAHHVQLYSAVQQIFYGIFVVAGAAEGAVAVIGVEVAGWYKIKALSAGVGIALAVVVGLYTLAAVQLFKHILIAGGGQQPQLVKHIQIYLVVLVQNKNNVVIVFRPVPVQKIKIILQRAADRLTVPAGQELTEYLRTLFHGGLHGRQRHLGHH